MCFRQEFLVSKVISNAADEVDEDFNVADHARNIRIAVTDDDWEYHQDEDDDINIINQQPHDDEEETLLEKEKSAIKTSNISCIPRHLKVKI